MVGSGGGVGWDGVVVGVYLVSYTRDNTVIGGRYIRIVET